MHITTHEGQGRMAACVRLFDPTQVLKVILVRADGTRETSEIPPESLVGITEVYLSFAPITGVTVPTPDPVVRAALIHKMGALPVDEGHVLVPHEKEGPALALAAAIQEVLA